MVVVKEILFILVKKNFKFIMVIINYIYLLKI